MTRNVVVDSDSRIAMLTRLFDEEEFARMVTLVDRLTSTVTASALFSRASNQPIQSQGDEALDRWC